MALCLGISQAERDRRSSICQGCPERKEAPGFRQGRCKVCGCAVAVRVIVGCPKDRFRLP